MSRGTDPHFMTSLSTVKTSPKWSFKGRVSYNNETTSPGPGAYTSVSPDATVWSKASRTIFGSSARDSAGGRHPPGPGPGQYSPQDDGKKTRMPKFGFGTGRRTNTAANKYLTPGPGAYDTASRVGREGSQYSVSGRMSDASGMLTPGPGAYQTVDKNTMSKKARSPNWSFGTSARGLQQGQVVTPGPGSYEHKTVVGRGPAYSMKARRNIGRKNDTPGPGSHGGTYTQFGY